MTVISVPAVYEKLYHTYGDLSWWPSDSPYETMIGAILVQNTNWKNVDKALENLKKLMPDEKLRPEGVLGLSEPVLAEAIRPSGYYNQKTERLILFTRWFGGYGYDVDRLKEKPKDDLRAELLKLKGIGPETADDMLVYALEKASFVIDAYTRRFFERLGYDVPKKYESFQNMFESALEQDTVIYNHYHALIVEHAKRHCLKTPLCEGCPVRDDCSFEQ